MTSLPPSAWSTGNAEILYFIVLLIKSYSTTLELFYTRESEIILYIYNP